MKPIKILLLVMAFFFSFDSVMAQSDKKEQRKMERAERKIQKAEEKKRKQEFVLELVKDQNFVIEANTVSGRYVSRFAVHPGTNFVKIEGDRVTVQTANNWGFGYNGLGGITINGNIKDYKVITNKKNNTSVLIEFTSPLFGLSTLNLHFQESGFASAMMVDNWGRRVTFQGQFFPLEDSRIFEGRPII